MARIEKEVTVDAPIEQVFSYVNDPNNLPEFWPSVIAVTDIRTLPNGGYSCSWAYKMAGLRFEGTAQDKEVVPNQWIVTETQGGIGSIITWTFRFREKATRVTLIIEYKVPVPLLGKLADAIIVTMNDQEADLIMANLRARFMRADK